ncbi:MAG: LysR family transcriptional regulator [Saprospiraceae bacterium]|nr:LysR family transcriptional regulator [Saprospiraceae bacterium]
MNYTLHQLQIFQKIVECESVTKAAQELYLSQPAVSIQLKKFQDQFSIPLTEVVGRKLYITDFGKEIATAAERILNEVEAITYKTMAYQGELSGKLKFSIVSTAKYVLPYFLSGFMADARGVDLNINVTNKASVLRSLEENKVDFALVSVIPDLLKINKVQLMQNKLFLVASSKLKVGKRSKWKFLEDVPLIYREEGSATRAAMEDFIEKNALPTYKKMEMMSNEALKQAVIAGLGCSIMPLIGIRDSLKNGELQIIPTKGLPIITHWNLIWLTSKRLSPVALAFLDYVEREKDMIIQDTFEWFERY